MYSISYQRIWGSVLFLLMLCISPAVLAQETQKVTLRSALSNLEQHFQVSFSYDDAIQPEQYIQLPKNITTLDDHLQHLSLNHQLNFRKMGRKVIAVTKADRTIRVSGVVRDSISGAILRGATIYLQSGKTQFRSDQQGEYAFYVPDTYLGEKLLVSYVGYNRAEIIINTNYQEVLMTSFDQSMEEVIITNTYEGPKLREETVGSVFALTAEQLQTSRPLESIDKMLEGFVPGLYVETNTALGTPVKINIRGQGTLSAMSASSRTTSSQPLFVIDGVPMQEQERGDAGTNFNQETLLNPLAGINPMDIASVTVLKDAAATTIYGANAANGVILITTKSGRSGSPRVQASFHAGVSTFINRIQLLSGPEYYEVLKETYMNGGMSERTAENLAGSNTIDTDWFGLTSRNANYTNIHASVSGGKEGNNYFLSVGYRDQQNASPGNGLKQYTGQFRYQNKISEKLRLTSTFTPTFMQRKGLDNFANNAYIPPNLEPYNTDGSFATFSNTPNPLAVLAYNSDESQTFTANAHFDLQYDITPSLYIRSAVGGNIFQSKQETYQSGQVPPTNTIGGRLRIYNRQNYNYTSFLQVGYRPNFSDDHKMLVILGTELRDQYSSLLFGSGSGFSYDKIRELSLATNKLSASSKISDATVSYYTQMNYDFRSKYYATLSGRADQSSLFGGDKQMAVNVAVGLGWNISNEDFLAESDIIDFLRLRTSFGSTGNSRIGSYASRGMYDIGSDYLGQVGARPSSLAAPNPDLGWETNYKTNIGVDISVLDRLHFTAEFYQNDVRDLIAQVRIPLETGYSSIPVNTGNMRNRGMDLSLAVDWFKEKPITWRSSFIAGWNKNKVLSFNNPLADQYAGTNVNEVGNAHRVGYSTNTIWGVQWAGVDPDTGEELFYTPSGETVNRVGIRALRTSAYIPLGNSLPAIQGGMVNTLSWNNMTLSFNIQYQLGGDRLVATTRLQDGLNLDHSNMAVNILDRWQKPGDITTVPKLSRLPPSAVTNSSRYLYDMTHIKLSNLSFSYSLNKELAQRLRLPNLSASFNVNNLFYWYKDKSPEGRNGIREFRFNYPETRNFSVGVQMTL